MRVEPSLHRRSVSMTIKGTADGGAMPGRQAGSGDGKYNAESPKQDSQKNVQLSLQTKHFAHLGLINLWWYTCLIEVGHPAAPAPEDGAAGAVRDLPDAAGRDVPRAEGLRACVCCVSY